MLEGREYSILRVQILQYLYNAARYATSYLQDSLTDFAGLAGCESYDKYGAVGMETD